MNERQKLLIVIHEISLPSSILSEKFCKIYEKEQEFCKNI